MKEGRQIMVRGVPRVGMGLGIGQEAGCERGPAPALEVLFAEEDIRCPHWPQMWRIVTQDSGLGNAFQEDWPDALFREGREEVRHAPPEVLPAERVEPRVGSEVLERLVAERGVPRPLPGDQVMEKLVPVRSGGRGRRRPPRPPGPPPGGGRAGRRVIRAGAGRHEGRGAGPGRPARRDGSARRGQGSGAVPPGCRGHGAPGCRIKRTVSSIPAERSSKHRARAVRLECVTSRPRPGWTSWFKAP